MEQNYAVVEISTDLIVNVIWWDGETPYDPGEGFEVLIMPEGKWIGDLYHS